MKQIFIVGAKIYGTASSGKHAFLKQRGLDEAIDYRTKDWAVELRRLTNGKGVALITDPLGGNHWTKSYRALRSTGRLGMFGVSVATTSKLRAYSFEGQPIETPTAWFGPTEVQRKSSTGP